MCYLKLILLYELTIALHSSGSNSFLNCCQVLIRFRILSGVNERHRGKTPIDVIGGTSKNGVYRDAMSEKYLIDTPKPFTEHVNKAVKGITSLCLPAEDVLIEPGDIEVSLIIKGILQIYMIERYFDEQNVPYLQFFKMATDWKPFFPHLYGEAASVHQKIAVNDNHGSPCLGDYESAEE